MQLLEAKVFTFVHYDELVNASSMYPPKQKKEVKEIVRLFITNSQKVFWVDKAADLSEEIVPFLPRKDIYLVQICLATNDKIIVTSDTTLYQKLLNTYDHLNIRAYMAEDFINQYPDIQ